MLIGNLNVKLLFYTHSISILDLLSLRESYYTSFLIINHRFTVFKYSFCLRKWLLLNLMFRASLLRAAWYSRHRRVIEQLWDTLWIFQSYSIVNRLFNKYWWDVGSITDRSVLVEITMSYVSFIESDVILKVGIIFHIFWCFILFLMVFMLNSWITWQIFTFLILNLTQMKFTKTSLDLLAVFLFRMT